MTTSTTNGDSSQSEEVWYVALKKLHIVQGPNVIPSSIRIGVGQRFGLDGDEAVDVDALLRTGAIKLYEESDAEWAQKEMTETRQATQRRARRGKN